MLGAVVYMYCRVYCREASEYMSNTVPIHVFTQYTVKYMYTTAPNILLPPNDPNYGFVRP